MKCPTCSKPTRWQDNPFRPFCSERCKLIDFGKWANEEYLVPGEEKPSLDGEIIRRPSTEDASLPDE